ncbi:inositol monophosphatase family protein [Desertihabitans aurantiacus]|uniref:inositol monophosphatase family protein n=1 Tax=Desertihabitans aurantiacus TaxID=2282477 RepID=UPI000DF80DEF|nr:inositol monophosphatase [Desertihabitans aurantiacus]
MTPHPDDVALSHRLAAAADAISAPLHGDPLRVSRKADGTLVSAADLLVEEALLQILREERAGDTVLSEEHGTLAGNPGRRWILDPIDGTDPFLSGQRSWGTHIALEVDGELEIAVITRPTEGRRWWAARGQGAWSRRADAPRAEDTALRVSTVDRLAAARVGGFVDPGSRTAAVIAEHARWVADPLGDVIGLVEGRVDAVIAPGGQLWDHAPQVLLTVEAGGRYTDRDGGSSPAVRGGLYTNGALHPQVLAVPELGWIAAR